MTQTVAFSRFHGVKDNRPKMRTMRWESFAELLEKSSKVAADRGAKKFTDCISPAQYEPGGTRGLACAGAWDWASVDLDDKTGQGWRFDEAVEYLDSMGLAYVVYSTTSSTSDAHSLRALMPLSRPVDPIEFRGFWYSLNAMFASIVDAQTKDISRLFVEPRAWIGAHNLFARSTGASLDPDEIMRQFPAPVKEDEAPPEIIRSIMDAMADRASPEIDPFVVTDLDHSPFVPAKALDAAIMAGQGGRMMSFLVSVALSAAVRFYPITEGELETIGKALAWRIGRTDTGDIRHDAKNALKFAVRRAAEIEAERVMGLSS